MGSISYVKAVAVFVVFSLAGCANDIAEVDALTESVNTSIEEGSGVEILYSDSAELKVRILADSIVRYVERSNPRDVFPSGIFIEFLSPQGRPTSWLEAETAVRSEKSNTFTARGNVRFYNKKNEKLVSTELIWDEAKSILHTEKFVTIIQAARKDTTYGFGFSSNEEFNIFEIKQRSSAVYRPDAFNKNK